MDERDFRIQILVIQPLLISADCLHSALFFAVCLQVRVKTAAELKQKPDVGCYIYGLFLEGARWDREGGQLIDSRPKELYTEMAVIWLIPKANRKPPTSGVYVCPIYKTLTRAGEFTHRNGPGVHISAANTCRIRLEVTNEIQENGLTETLAQRVHLVVFLFFLNLDFGFCLHSGVFMCASYSVVLLLTPEIDSSRCLVS